MTSSAPSTTWQLWRNPIVQFGLKKVGLCTIRPQWFSTLYSTPHYNYYFWTSMRALRWVVVLYLMGLGGRWCLLHLATDRHISLLIHVTWNIVYPAKGNGLCMMINITTAMQCRSHVSYNVILFSWIYVLEYKVKAPSVVNFYSTRQILLVQSNAGDRVTGWQGLGNGNPPNWLT